MKLKFTEKSVAALLENPPSKECKISNADIPGYGIRCRPGRAPDWDLQFRLAGKQQRMSFGKVMLGTVASINRQAAEAYAKVKLGQDPRGERQTTPASDSIGAVLKLYLPQKKASTKKRSYTETERHLLRDAAPLHALPLRSEPFVMTTALLPLFTGSALRRTTTCARRFRHSSAGRSSRDSPTATRSSPSSSGRRPHASMCLRCQN